MLYENHSLIFEIADQLFGLKSSIETIKSSKMDDKDRLVKALEEAYFTVNLDLDPRNKILLDTWEEKIAQYKNEVARLQKIVAVDTADIVDA